MALNKLLYIEQKNSPQTLLNENMHLSHFGSECLICKIECITESLCILKYHMQSDGNCILFFIEITLRDNYILGKIILEVTSDDFILSLPEESGQI